MKLTPMGVIAPILARGINTIHNTSELLGQAKSMLLIKCHQFRNWQCSLIVKSENDEETLEDVVNENVIKTKDIEKSSEPVEVEKSKRYD